MCCIWKARNSSETCITVISLWILHCHFGYKFRTWMRLQANYFIFVCKRHVFCKCTCFCRCVRLTTLPPSCAVVTKSGNLNFIKPSGPVQTCNRTALPFTCFCRLSTARPIVTYNSNTVISEMRHADGQSLHPHAPFITCASDKRSGEYAVPQLGKAPRYKPQGRRFPFLMVSLEVLLT